jgi:hypothetical protein
VDFAILRGNFGETSFTGDWALDNWSFNGAPPLDVPIDGKKMNVNSGTAIVYESATPVPTALSLNVISLDPAATTATVEIQANALLTVTEAVNVGVGGTVNVNGTLTADGLSVAIGGTLMLGDGSTVVLPEAATAPVTITINGTIANDGVGVGDLGDRAVTDPVDATNLTLTDGSVYEWTFGGDGVDSHISVTGDIVFDEGAIIRLNSGGLEADGTYDVVLFRAHSFGITQGEIDDNLDNITFEGLAGWTYTLGTEWRSSDPDADYLVLKTLETPEPATMSLLAIGGLGLLMMRRRRRA